METKSNILQNPYEEKIAQSEKQLRSSSFGRSLVKEFAQKPYSETWRWSYLGAVVASYLANVFSFATGAFAVGYLLQSQFSGLLPSGWAMIFSGILACSAALTLEAIKRNTSGNFFRAGYAQKQWRWATASGVGLLMLLSVGLTFYGASKLPSLTTPLPSLESVEALNLHYNNRIAEKRASILELQTSGKRGNHLRGRAIDAIHNLEVNIQNLEQEQAEKAATLQQRNAKMLKDYNKNLTESGSFLGYLSILLEVLFVLCFAFMKRYLWRSYLERCEGTIGGVENLEMDEGSGGRNYKSRTTGAGRNEGKKEGGDQRQPIGFKIPQNSVITGVSGEKERTVFIKNTVTHINKITGKAQELTERDIMRFVRTYTKRVKETNTRINNEGETLALQTELENREQNLLYWMALLHKLHRQLAERPKNL